MPTPRRDFLQWLGAGSAMAAIGGPLPSALHTVNDQKPVSDKWDMSWCDRVTGSARGVFDSPGISEGAAIFRAVIWQRQQHDVYGTDPGGMTAVVVLRHEAIPLVMDHEYWQRFEIGKSLKLRTAQGKKWAVTNPVGPAPADAKPEVARYTIPAFIASGGIVLACNMAFSGIVESFKERDKLSADDARKQAINHLIPGIILQPSGGFAVLRAQQSGCGYMLGS